MTARPRISTQATASNVWCNELLLVDCRPHPNATANKGRGGGYEDVGRYERKVGGSGQRAFSTRLAFMDIDNIHEMRRSLDQLHQLFFDAGGGGKQGTVATFEGGDLEQMLDWVGGGSKLYSNSWAASVQATGWLGHVGRVLAAASVVAATISQRKQSVLVHCSDGWDRTSQLTVRT
jgi:myotubularin-related protein 1/2